MIYENFGVWSSKDGLVDFRTSRVLSRRRRNLNGHRFIAPTVFQKNGSENHMDLDDYQSVSLKKELIFSIEFFSCKILFSHHLSVIIESILFQNYRF